MFNFFKKRIPELRPYDPQKTPFGEKALKNIQTLFVLMDEKKFDEAKKVIREKMINNLMLGGRDDLVKDAKKILDLLEKKDVEQADKKISALMSLLDNEYSEQD